VRAIIPILALMLMMMFGSMVSASQFTVVVNNNGNPVVVRVDLYKNGKCVYTDWTDERGVLKIENLPPDEYTLVINNDKAYKVDFTKTDIVVINIGTTFPNITVPTFTFTEQQIRYIFVGIIVMTVLIGSYLILTRKGGGR
jgi:hypothetical protein